MTRSLSDDEHAELAVLRTRGIMSGVDIMRMLSLEMRSDTGHEQPPPFRFRKMPRTASTVVG